MTLTHNLDFWMNEEPSNWTLIHYLTKLLQKSPTTGKRDAHTQLSHDVLTMKRYVIEGTIADTSLTLMGKANKVSCVF